LVLEMETFLLEPMVDRAVLAVEANILEQVAQEIHLAHRRHKETTVV
jgi:hypothetical protein